jgi:AAA domain
MPKTSDIVLGGRFMGLFVGANGTGKTIAAASWPGNTLFLDFDGRMAPVRFFYPKRTDIEYWTVGLDGTQRPDVIGFTDFCKKVEDLQDRCPYDTVVLDSYTAYSAVAVLHQMGVHDKDVKRTKGGLPIPDWDEYKGETGVMLQILEVAKILPCNFIMTAHPVSKAQAQKQGGSTNDVLASMIKQSTLATYGWKTVSFLPNYFNEIYYFYNETATQPGQPLRRSVQTVAVGEVLAKTALPLPPTMETANLPFFNVLQAHLKDYEIKLQEKAKEKGESGKVVSISQTVSQT